MPLDADEREGLLLSHVSTRGELNEVEQANILEAEQWAHARRRDVLSEKALNELHKRMFGRVWKWAGQFRTTEKNIGIPPFRIAPDLRQLIDDCRHQLERRACSPDELAARFHHRLVSIHAYPNGNGRHARLAADLLVESLGQPRFTWGSASLVDAGAARRRYVDALRAADVHDIRPLLEFMRT